MPRRAGHRSVITEKARRIKMLLFRIAPWNSENNILFRA